MQTQLRAKDARSSHRSTHLATLGPCGGCIAAPPCSPSGKGLHHLRARSHHPLTSRNHRSPVQVLRIVGASTRDIRIEAQRAYTRAEEKTGNVTSRAGESGRGRREVEASEDFTTVVGAEKWERAISPFHLATFGVFFSLQSGPDKTAFSYRCLRRTQWHISSSNRCSRGSRRSCSGIVDAAAFPDSEL